MTTDMRNRAGIEATIAELVKRFPGRVETGAAVRAQHANTASGIACEPPDAVVWPETTEEVSAIVKVAAAHRCPVIAFGAGTSLEGHVNAPFGGISLDIIHIN